MRSRTRDIKQFLYGHYFSDGIRISLGVLLPSLIFSQVHRFEMGVTISLGALCVSIADNPGPLVHKRNGMLFCTLFIVAVSLLTGLVNGSPVLLGATVALLSFFFSMFAVYGNRATSVGTAALVVMVLTMDKRYPLPDMLIHTMLIAGGGLWYMLLSLSSYQILPYRPAQQTLGECIMQVARFMRIKADFYTSGADFTPLFSRLVDQQIIVNQEQDNVREMLFKSRLMVKESTKNGRMLILTFVDVVDLFEQIMATHYDYPEIHARFERTGILSRIESVIRKLANELDNIGFAILSNNRFRSRFNGVEELETLRLEIEEVANIPGIESNLVLRKILVNLRNINQRISAIQSYFGSSLPDNGLLNEQLELPRFITHQDYDWRLLRNNLNIRSSSFKHALRVSLVTLIGFLVSKLFYSGTHSYWIVLTILVVLKPGFGLSKERSYQRLVGTFAGGIIGMLVLYFFPDKTVQFILLLFFMVGTYSFQRINYITSVVFMTPYILILFNFLGAGDFNIVKERVLDTLIGSAIAFLAIYVIFPNWESEQLRDNLGEVLKANKRYLQVLLDLLSGKKVTWADYRVARKEVYVSSANLAAAFQRMLTEPKNKQKESKEVQKFVVLNHILSSYIANMTTSMLENDAQTASHDQVRLARKAIAVLSEAIRKIEPDYAADPPSETATVSPVIPDDNTESQLITEQLDFVNKISGDIARTADNLSK
ncbi:MAG: FUSC family protein [Mucilaginibacter polytrichastri]|nr:FUSC family protein [Mucilaginibacter polytrichastri]